MEPKKMLRTFLVMAILGSTVGCDQVSKHIVRETIGNNEEISVIKDYMTLMKVQNSGAFMSAGHALPLALKKVLLTFFPVFFLTLLLVYALTKRGLSTIAIFGICFVVGGGIGNVYDRVVYGSVTDFMHIDFVIFQTGIFNIADVAIMAGILMVVSEYYLKRMQAYYFNGNKSDNA